MNLERIVSVFLFTVILVLPWGGPVDVSGVEPFDAENHIEISVIVNKQFPAESLSESDLKKLYLGSKTKIDGKTVVICALQKGDVHKAFLKKYIGKSASQFRNHWKRLEFTGKGKPPKWFSSEEKLLAYVAEKPGAIGYVSRDKATEKVVKLKIEP